MSEKRVIFNPLQAIASSGERAEVTASLFNEEVGVCPKCNQPMIRAVIANNDTVFYCEADRVSTPLPDDQCTPTI